MRIPGKPIKLLITQPGRLKNFITTRSEYFIQRHCIRHCIIQSLTLNFPAETLQLWSTVRSNPPTCAVCNKTLSLLKNFILSHADALEDDIISMFCKHLPEDPAKAVRENGKGVRIANYLHDFKRLENYYHIELKPTRIRVEAFKI